MKIRILPAAERDLEIGMTFTNHNEAEGLGFYFVRLRSARTNR